MTKQEAIKILAMIESIYSYCMAKNETVNHWFEFSSQLEYEKVMERLKKHIRNSPYPPAIGEIAAFPEHDEDNYNHNQWMDEYSIK